jgi:endonuclease/exonuclease/phosphatase family metal-dependent hydrolase
VILKVFHLNIYFGFKIDDIIAYIQKHDFDIIHLQEVATGEISFHKNNCFLDVKRDTGYEGIYAPTWNLLGDKNSTTGNAIFYQKKFSVVDAEVIWLKEYAQLNEIRNRNWREDPRNAIAIMFEKDGLKFHTINTHLAWGPTEQDEPYKLEQAQKLYQHVSRLPGPYILTGDFNVTKKSAIVGWFDSIARNITTEHAVTNTLNKKFHKSPHLFPPGLAVDFLYVSKEIKVNKFQLVDSPDLSDHFALYVECEI